MIKILLIIAVLVFTPMLAFAAGEGDGEFVLKSRDIAEGKPISPKHVFNGFGCTGENIAPSLAWQNAPKETKSYAITVHDPDAPTGSGWWHWLVYNISATEYKLDSSNNTLFSTLRNDYGLKTYGGPCPPQKDGFHRYNFTIYALPVEKLDIPEDASAALLGFQLNANAVGSSTITAIYDRK